MIQIFLWIFVGTSFLTPEGIYPMFVKRFCLKKPQFAILCHNALFLIEGFDYGNMDVVCFCLLYS